MSTLALAGLPMLQQDNKGHIVAMQTIAKKLNIGLFFNDMKELGIMLKDKPLMSVIRNNVWQQRHLFTFDYHADALIDFFKAVIDKFQSVKKKTSIPLVVPFNTANVKTEEG